MDASKKAVATHDELGPRSNDCDIVGSAVLTTLPSNAESKIGTQIPVKHLQKPGPLAHSSCESPSSLPFFGNLRRDSEDNDE